MAETGQRLSSFIGQGPNLDDDKTYFITIYNDVINEGTTNYKNQAASLGSVKTELNKQYYTKDQTKALEPFVTTINDQKQVTDSFKLLMNYVRPRGDYYWNDEAEPQFTALEKKPETWVENKYYKSEIFTLIETQEKLNEVEEVYQKNSDNKYVLLLPKPTELSENYFYYKTETKSDYEIILNQDELNRVNIVYVETGPNSPNALFGGTWVQVKGQFILAAGGKYIAGKSGGEADHTLDISEMPKHNHDLIHGPQSTYTATSGGYGIYNNSKNLTSDGYIAEAGGSKPHNNMPPYYTTYVWRRTGLYTPANS